jgi:hypothetical protein
MGREQLPGHLILTGQDRPEAQRQDGHFDSGRVQDFPVRAQITGRPQPPGQVHLADQGRHAIGADDPQQARMPSHAGHVARHLDVGRKDSVDIDALLLPRAAGLGFLLRAGGPRLRAAGPGRLLIRIAGLRLLPGTGGAAPVRDFHA